MFRAAFHTGYVPCGVLRLTKQQLDGACADDRFHQVMAKYFIAYLGVEAHQGEQGVSLVSSLSSTGNFASADRDVMCRWDYLSGDLPIDETDPDGQ